MTFAPHSTQPSAARGLQDLVSILALGSQPSEPTLDPTQSYTELDHALQCAALLRSVDPDDLELQVAGLLHDIGHTLVPGAVDAHGVVGANWVRGLLGERVAALIELHVPAKRYLVTIDPEYRDRLSPGSITTLAAQGESMTEAEVEAFRAHPHHRSALLLRRADEGAKVPGLSSGTIEDWVPSMQALISG